MEILKVSNLSKIYRTGKVANNNINLTLERGELWCLMGPNGAGKTTFVRQVAGLLKPSKGDIWIKGIRVNDEPKLVKEIISYQPQFLYGLKELTFYEALFFTGCLNKQHPKEVKRCIEEYLEFFHLQQYRNVMVGNLSGGLRKILSFIIAALKKPLLLILDEPTAGLDPIYRKLLWKKISEINSQGTTIIITSHNLSELEEHIQRYAVINDGRFIKEGYLKELFDEGSINRSMRINIFPYKGFESDIKDILRGSGFKMKSSNDGAKIFLDCSDADILKFVNLYHEKNLSPLIRRIVFEKSSLEDYYFQLLDKERSLA
jgi:ABC-2 type transport system ATP-binding protein